MLTFHSKINYIKEVFLIKNKRLWIIIILIIIFIAIIIKPENKNTLIIIDPGHGGKDPRTIGFNNEYEKDIVLKVLRETSMKLFIIEAGFLSNIEESLMLNNDNYQNLIVDGILKSVEVFYKKNLI